MKTRSILFFFVLALSLLVYGVTSHPEASVSAVASSDIPEDEGGDGFISEDPCGFLMGTSTGSALTAPYDSAGHNIIYGVKASAVSPNRFQACADRSYNFYSTSNGARDSRLIIQHPSRLGTTYALDLAGAKAETSTRMALDENRAFWQGFAYITSPGFTGNRWVWFDWNCRGYTGSAGGPSSTSGCVNNAYNYHVWTDLTTGITEGYAWNDTLGFIRFNALDLELPPEEIRVDVDVLDANGDAPHEVDSSSAPLADGYDYWRIRVRFYDTDGDALTESQIASLSIDPLETADSRVYLNQVDNTGDAILLESWNPSLGCSTPSAPYCSITEDGVWSANYFVYSGAPTSNMLGVNNDSDAAVDVLTDRAGCRSIYADQIALGASNCGASREEVFYQRSSERNRYELESIQLDVEFNLAQDAVVLESSQMIYNEITGFYTALPAQDWDLSFRPRLQTTRFQAHYNGQDQNVLPDRPQTGMTLVTEGNVVDASTGYVRAQRVLRPAYTLSYQTAVDVDPVLSSTHTLLLLDSLSPSDAVPDCTHRENLVQRGVLGSGFSAQYALNYGVRHTSCGGASGGSTNSYENPTVEQWVCDTVSTARYSGPSCYYTAYLEVQDRYADPLPVSVQGTVSRAINGHHLLDNTEELSVIPTPDAIALRNVMYAKILRYMSGRTASGGTLNADMDPSSGLLTLLGGDLLVAEGDVTIQGSSRFTDKTLVVLGGDVSIEGNVSGGHLGLLVLKDSGEGGNVYIAPDVTYLEMNMFLDGSLHSYDGVTLPNGAPVWSSDEERASVLANQLYLHGSLIARNTVGATEDTSLGVWDLGDGTTTTSYAEAREYDLNQLRMYRLCYPVDEENNILIFEDPVPCNEGELLSDYGRGYRGGSTLANPNYAPFIFEYRPSDGLPIFWEETALFQ